MTLEDFLDLEELSVVARDRKMAWEMWVSQNPTVLEGVVPGVEPKK